MKMFFLLQAIIFGYLALDERFMLHERIGFVLGIHDAILLLMVGVAELAVLYFFKQIGFSILKINKFILLAAVGFLIMLVIDAFGASRGFLRLSAEDLLKLWAIFFLYQYAMQLYWNLKLVKQEQIKD